MIGFARLSVCPSVGLSVMSICNDRVEKWNKEQFRYFLCTFVRVEGERWGLGCGWELDAPAHPSATIL